MGVSQRSKIAVAAALLVALVLAIPVLARPDRAAIELTRTCQVGNSSLRPGNYVLEFDGNKVSFLRGGKAVAEATGEWKKSPQKARDTSVVYETSGRIIEIRPQGRDSYFVIQ